MRYFKVIGGRLVMTLLAAVLACGSVPVHVAWGIEASQDVVAYNEEPGQAVDGADGAADDESGAKANAAEVKGSENKQSLTSALSGKATEQSSQPAPAVPLAADESSEPATVAAEEPYSIEATFDGTELVEGEGVNNFDSTSFWTSSQDTKFLNVILKRNASVPVKAGKKYILALSVSDSLYFGGVPTADSITGVSAVAMKKNTAPVFNTRYGRTESYPLSSYSGEMRFELNTSVDQVTVEGIGVRFDPTLLGYKTNGSTLENPIVAKVVEVDSDCSLDGYVSENEQKVISRKVDALTIKNTLDATGSISFYSSNNGFETSIVGQGNSASSEGSLSYALSTSAFTEQVFGSLTVEFNCPYVEVNGQKRYLDFDQNESVLSTNKPAKSGTAAGWNLDSAVTYDESAHTLIYHFKNVKLERYAFLAYTPTFTLPEDLKESIPDGNGYSVKSAGWVVLEQTNYNGDATTLMRTAQGIGVNYFKKDGSNIRLRASIEDASLSNRNIYEGITPGSGATASLGLFDLHNTGVSDSPEVRVDFDFNTEGGTGATYYVTQVNLPFYGMGDSVAVSYELTDGSTGKKTVKASSNFSLTRGSLGAQGDVYIKHVSYVTKLRNNTAYHQEVTHGGRNRAGEPCVFLGQMTGELGQTAKATMTITSADDVTPITQDGKTQVSATEISTISDDNSTGFGLNRPTIGTSSSTMAGTTLITAGDTANLAVSFSISTEEYPTPGLSAYSVNGYHVVESPVLYICLPDGVSIAGKDQVSANVSGRKVTPNEVAAVDGSGCVVNGVSARWWRVEFDGANAGINGSMFAANLQLSTDYTMQSLAWDFSNKIVIRSKGQKATWNCASQYTSGPINTLSGLRDGDVDSLNALADGLVGDSDAETRMGMFVYTVSSGTMLNIARAEAKLDVDTKLSTGSDASQSLKVTDPDADIDYAVSVSSADGGHADAFEYYVPIPKTTSTIDTSSFVSQNDYDLQLKKAVKISDLSSSNAMLPFEVYYTTKPGLDSASVRNLEFNDEDASAGWMSEDEGFADFAHATAVLIMTKTSSQIAKDAKYRFDLSLGYDNTDNKFASKAGYAVQWRSFGHYVYTRNGSSTENTYPSQVNSVRLGYNADLTNTPIVAELKTDADDGVASFGRTLSLSFAKAQMFTVKNVVVSGGTTLVTDDPSSFTGANANSMFRMALGVNGTGTSTIKNGYSGGTFSISAGTAVNVSGGVRFSKALTDTTTERYADVVLGNDDINVKVRIKLNRTVKAASATKSGTVVGEQFQAANVSSGAKTIASNGAFTALYVVNDFVPGNFSEQKLVWKKDGEETPLPKDATVTMLVLNDEDAVSSRWVWRSSGESSVDLSRFTRMAGSGSFSYDTTSTSATTLKYQFVVCFPAERRATGGYALAFEATPVSGATSVSVSLPVTLASPSSFTLAADGGNVTYSYTNSAGDDVRTTGKQLALVLTPAAGTTLPADAAIKVGNNVYARNASGYYIVPLGTVESGSKELSLVSSMVGAKGGSYAFDTKLMLYSGADVSPMAGSQVGDTSVTLGIAASASPSIKVTGTRVAHKSEWSGGVDFSFVVNGVPDGGSVTVSAYNGLKLTTPATNLMSSVGGMFDINGGTGTYKDGTSNGKLVLSPAVDAGTYRLVFEVKDAGGTVLATATHYVIVRN